MNNIIEVQAMTLVCKALNIYTEQVTKRIAP